jgi:alkylation response protein AidB-like acyl-CoA dehydrogenase
VYDGCSDNPGPRALESETQPSCEQLLSRVAQIAPILDDTAAESERQRKLCPEAVEALHEAGLFGLWGPLEAGGYDADLVTQVDVLIAVARADMSACWTMMIGNTVSGLMARGLPDEGFAEVFDGERLAIGAGSLKPSGHAKAVEGGYVATGKWGFGSGIHHSEWIVANCLAEETSADVVPVSLVVPISEVEIHDDWHVAGLCGSGSSSYSITDVFVPHHRVMSRQPKRGDTRNGNPPPRLPLEHASVSLGGARRALDEVAAQALSKKRLMDVQTVSDKQAFQVELGRLEALWASLRAGVRSDAADLWEIWGAGDAQELNLAAAKFRATCAYATETSLTIGSRALRHAGAGAVHGSNVLQRIHRDLTVSAQHAMISDVSYEAYGKLILA